GGRARRLLSHLAHAGGAVRARAGRPRMTSFSAKWLGLREPYDRVARSTSVLDAGGGAFPDRRARFPGGLFLRPRATLRALACGPGGTLGAIAPRLPAHQAWRLVDNDLGLLAQAAALARPPERTVEARPVDLVRDLELALDGAVDLITTSALLDLVSSEWI